MDSSLLNYLYKNFASLLKLMSSKWAAAQTSAWQCAEPLSC